MDPPLMTNFLAILRKYVINAFVKVQNVTVCISIQMDLNCRLIKISRDFGHISNVQ